MKILCALSILSLAALAVAASASTFSATAGALFHFTLPDGVMLGYSNTGEIAANAKAPDPLLDSAEAAASRRPVRTASPPKIGSS